MFLIVVLEHIIHVLALVVDFESRRIFRPHLSLVVQPRRRNIRMPQPLLNFRDIASVVQSVDRSRRPQ